MTEPHKTLKELLKIYSLSFLIRCLYQVADNSIAELNELKISKKEIKELKEKD